ncbi:hypothetical protein [Wenjunlia tyrosinilytica]|uniref:Uncharacterized protein n=1 Tax=Wenjunlia tyrosinilytica TaxID=1544741 RepID=A0A917ZNL7_9ACTN|nr:hypothetical protein [Wenjunlia tyrosinilytica]GGO86483.1 hypothetical protein GCM10012280_22700 [Wenjunlia tyrosinilytica]
MNQFQPSSFVQGPGLRPMVSTTAAATFTTAVALCVMLSLLDTVGSATDLLTIIVILVLVVAPRREGGMHM